MIKNNFVILVLIAILALSGCQSKEASSDVSNNQPPSASASNIPFSKGPSEAPSVKGPTAPPPAQAVTKNENIRLTLPLKTDS